MGFETYTHIGPYFEVRSEKRVERRDMGCESCPGPGSKFCSVCGIDQSKRFYKFVVRPDFCQLFGGYESLSDTTRNIGDVELEDDGKIVSCLIPNQRRGRHREFGSDRPVEVDYDMIKDETGWLFAAFNKEFEILKSNFGKDNVKIKWGFLIWRL